MIATNPKIRRTQAKPHIRWMLRRDLSEVLDIDAGAFDEPWSEQDYTTCLMKRNVIAMVVDLGDKVVGYIVYEINRRDIKMLRFAVANRVKRRGIGAAIMERMAGKLSPYRRRSMRCIVPERNMDALKFLRAMDFKATRLIRDRFTDGDGIEMTYALPVRE